MDPIAASGVGNSPQLSDKTDPATNVKVGIPLGTMPSVPQVKSPSAMPLGDSNQLPPTLTSAMVPPVKPADVLMRKSNKGPLMTVILIMLIIGLIGGGGFYVYQAGWLDSIKAMVLNKVSPVSPSDITSELTEPSATPTLPVPTPTPVAVIVPEGWLTLNSQRCGVELSYPASWSGQASCRSINEGGAADCVMSENFSGLVTGTEPTVTQGMLVMLQDCISNSEGPSYTIDKFLQSCNQTNQELGLGECQLMGTTGTSFVIATLGRYVTVVNGVSYTLQVFPPPPTTFSLLNQMLGTFKVTAVTNTGSEVVTPPVASDSGVMDIN